MTQYIRHNQSRVIGLLATILSLIAVGWLLPHPTPEPKTLPAVTLVRALPPRVIVKPVPGPTRIVTKTVPGPTRIVVKTRTVVKFVSRSRTRADVSPQPNESQLVAFGRLLQGRGFSVSEHPAFGGVDFGAHSSGSAHYSGQAIDVNWNGANETSRINEIVGLARDYGLRTIWQYPGHYRHGHFDTRPGPDL